jgi:pimeloyl-ACP methyl ester carboxylesterase
MENTVVLRTGRTLEVREYGDAGGHPILFFHGLIGSHHQASYIDDQARRHGLWIIAPNRPGVGRSEFIRRKTPLEVVADVEDVTSALKLDEFSVIGISGGTPYALATLLRLGSRIRTTTIISGMGPMQLPGALHGMDRRRRMFLAAGSRYPHLARRVFQKEAEGFKVKPERLLDRLITTWSKPDRILFRRRDIYELFLLDMDQVFSNGHAPQGLSQELTIYRNYGFALRDLPTDQRVVVWHGLNDSIVPPTMAWAMARTLPNCEAHLVPGGHFMAVDAAAQIIARLRQMLDVRP